MTDAVRGSSEWLTDDVGGAVVRGEAPRVEVVPPGLDAAVLDLEDAARPQLGQLAAERHSIQPFVHDDPVVGDLEEDLVGPAGDIRELLRELADAVAADRGREGPVVPHRVLGAGRDELVGVTLLPQQQELADQCIIGVHQLAPVQDHLSNAFTPPCGKRACVPPSTTMFCPEMKEASSEIRKTSGPAISSGRPNRASGTPSSGGERVDVGAAALVEALDHARRGDDVGRHRVDADAVRAPFVGHGAGEVGGPALAAPYAAWLGAP